MGLPSQYIKDKIKEISNYHQTALHWNTTHFNQNFEQIYRQAVQSYQLISDLTGVGVHSANLQLNELNKYLENSKFSLTRFKTESLAGSFKAAQREILTLHKLEQLADGRKGYFSITNMLGGEYHLTADEICFEDEKVVIQEAKNSSGGKFPSLDDIQDGLFKLILYSNLAELYLKDTIVKTTTRLKLTGNLTGMLKLPATEIEVEKFSTDNFFSKRAKKVINLLNTEVKNNQNLEVQIAGNL